VMDADLLLEGFLGALPDEHRERVGKMRDKATYLLDMVRDYLNLARLEEGTLQASIREDVDFGEDVLEPARSLLEEALRKKGMTLAARTEGEVGPLAIDPDLFRIVMTNLIGNAVKYGREGGEIRVLCDWPPGGFSCAVWNEGPGFSPAMRTRLFHKFSRLPEKPLIREKGSGVGLYVVQQIVLLHDGRVDARSEPGQWAEFSFTIPRRPPIAKGESA
jgi:signal transduction histidine kinase